MFAIGLGLIVSFSPDGVHNKNYLNRIRKSVKNVRDNFLLEFFIISICFVVVNMEFLEIKLTYKLLKFNFLIFCGVQTFFSIFYFAYNFLEIQKLKDDIFDRVLSDRLQG
ncbi:hypothetical protein [Oligella sp. MSHR50489EDL]|uniref:hypothetical protein n=1 Tax=Oligella sp. MSHR50489EDL TaxID=3139409 RepID=UPI003D81A829